MSGNQKGCFKHHAKAKALGLRYLQHNPHNLVCFLVLDLDHDDAAFAWSDTGLPMPNIITLNRDNGRGHYIYILQAPVAKSENARPKPLAYLAAIEYNYNRLLDGDFGYTNLITKNPFHSEFRTTFLHDTQFTLEHLSRSFKNELQSPPKGEKAVGIGRHVSIFDDLRFWAYPLVQSYRDNQDYLGFYGSVQTYAEALNRQFSEPLPDSHVRSTVKSVANWTYTHYTGSGGKRKGVMRLDEAGVDLTLAEKQSMGAAYAAQAKRKATEDKIIDVIGQLTASGSRVSVAAIARETGITRQALYKDYKHLIRS